ncbi:MAG: 30S ribosomal protein S21, partial [Bacilli bacterium]|nr:30S ribosomal protein S21 [Bacilli bacterium]
DTLKRFKRDVSRSGTLQEARKREHFLKPSDIRKMKKRAMKKTQYRRSN